MNGPDNDMSHLRQEVMVKLFCHLRLAEAVCLENLDTVLAGRPDPRARFGKWKTLGTLSGEQKEAVRDFVSDATATVLGAVLSSLDGEAPLNVRGQTVYLTLWAEFYRDFCTFVEASKPDERLRLNVANEDTLLDRYVTFRLEPYGPETPYGAETPPKRPADGK